MTEVRLYVIEFWAVNTNSWALTLISPDTWEAAYSRFNPQNTVLHKYRIKKYTED